MELKEYLEYKIKEVDSLSKSERETPQISNRDNGIILSVKKIIYLELLNLLKKGYLK